MPAWRNATRKPRAAFPVRRFSADIRVRFGDTPVLVSVREGRVVAAEIARGPLASWDFSLSAGADAWTRFWQPVPRRAGTISSR